MNKKKAIEVSQCNKVHPNFEFQLMIDDIEKKTSLDAESLQQLFWVKTMLQESFSAEKSVWRALKDSLMKKFKASFQDFSFSET